MTGGAVPAPGGEPTAAERPGTDRMTADQAAADQAAAGRPAAERAWGRADAALLGLAWTALVLIAAQFALAGLGAFTTVRAPGDNAYGPHEVLGLVIGIVTWVILGTALASRPARAAPATLRLAVPLALLAMPAEPLLGDAGRHVPGVGALHALTGLAICGLAAGLAVASGRRRAAARPGRAPPGGPRAAPAGRRGRSS
jgi:hypothetical protein